MSIDSAHFLCKNCETIFSGALGQHEERVCPHCDEFVVGGSPVAALQILDDSSQGGSHTSGPMQLEPQPRGDKRVRKTRKRSASHSGSEKDVALKTTESLVGEPIKVHVRKELRKIPYGRYFLLVFIWVAIVGGVGWFLRKGGSSSPNSTLAAVERTAKEKDIRRRREYVAENLAECQSVLLGFLNAPVTSRTSFVKEPDRVSINMNRYYRDIYESVNPSGRLSFVDANLLNVGEQIAIESLWKDELGKPLEAVFFLESGRWKLDWEHFVRAGDQALITFVNKPTGSRGIFRIAIRERLAETRRQRNAYNFSISQPAILGTIKESREEATASLDLESDILKDYLKYLEMREAGETVFESHLISIDSGSFNRVTVELEVAEKSGRRAKVKILRFIRPHWLGTELLGYDLTSLDKADAESDEDREGN